MLKVVRVIEERELPFLCCLRDQEVVLGEYEFFGASEGAEALAEEMQAIVDAAPQIVRMVSGYNRHGHYIGDEKTTRELVLMRKIAPELAEPTDNVCSIGWCDDERKWYGWSHRAINGFGIGDVIKEGDCAYEAPDADTFGRQMMEFFLDETTWHLNRSYQEAVDADGTRGCLISAVYSDKVPNEKLRGKRYEKFCPYPKTFGRGEWVVETIDDARIAAVAFAESVG